MINLSNHPSSKWSQAQLNACCNPVIDIPFPNVPPDATDEYIAIMANTLFLQIEQLEDMEIHVMGEMTLTFYLVHLLLENGYTVFASTTNRNVVEKDGVKSVVFEFCQFRNYRL